MQKNMLLKIVGVACLFVSLNVQSMMRCRIIYTVCKTNCKPQISAFRVQSSAAVAAHANRSLVSSHAESSHQISQSKGSVIIESANDSSAQCSQTSAAKTDASARHSINSYSRS